MKNICLAGDGWGTISAYQSLKSRFDSLYIVTRDEDLKELSRSSDVVFDDFPDIEFDIIVCSGYKPILSEEFVNSNRVINIHYSLLPKYRGMHSTVWAILNGETSMGLTIHEMNQYMDDGDIIHQYSFSYDNQTASEVIEVCNGYIEKELVYIIEEYLNGNIRPRKQSKELASWVCKRSLEDCKLDFSWDITFLARFFKALTLPYPLPFFYYGDKRLTVAKSKLVECDVKMTIGRIVNIDNEGLWIQVKGGYMVISLLLDDNGDNFNLSSFKIGERL
ncbi:methionyl-tRNA formyltransferase [Vibrio pelagius]|uniref:methionyl-tRNA formyltransferase n=1 Tax=Vibrio pelagius TaxID=28169 RepID=UPI003552FED7